MGEPWLDSLSEDWNSEPRSSSPASSLANSRYGTQNFRESQSRIPHLAHSMRRDSINGSFLKPRSARGRAKANANGMPILSERSASSLNMPSQTAHNSSKKRLTSSTLPRRASSNFSESQQSQQSVQHHTVHTSRRETPEWKRRLQNGEDMASDGFDLFSPSKLEGMFAQPAQPALDQENQSTFVETDTKPWTALKASNLSAPADQYLSYRTSRSRAPPMESLPELSEDETDDEIEHSMSAISSELARGGSLKCLVSRRVGDLEQRPGTDDHEGHGGRVVSSTSEDPRWRTASGQQEIRNEFISPLTASAKNTISEKAVWRSVDLNPQVLEKKLIGASLEQQRRPSSRSSDREVSYDGGGPRRRDLLHEESIADMTSHSLPEDLSMGTQDFMSNGGYVNPRRGVASNETSFLIRKLSSLDESPEMKRQPALGFRSSPPPYNSSKIDTHDQSKLSADDLTDLQDGSVLHHETSPQRPVSVGSPLKLFGNRDTYTNNKLLRVLSQFEDGSDQSKYTDDETNAPDNAHHPETGLRMSQFGKGELDAFNFEKEVQRPTTAPAALENDGEKIFQSFADLTIEDEGTTYEQRPAKAQIPQTTHESPDVERLPSQSSTRSPKRRRTLVRDEITVEGVDIEVRVDRVLDKTSLAGRKRKDARPGEGGAQADPEVLASRAMLRPKPGSRKSSNQSQNGKTPQTSTLKPQSVPEELKEALAAELASFAQGVSEIQQDSRKPSLATKDYMEEANKVMEFIRARGKPIPKLTEIQEPLEVSELDADRTFDLDLDEDSTQEPFSRPPSREGPTRPREDRRIAKHDAQTENHLRKFKDSDDLEMLASTSVIGTLQLPDNRMAAEAAKIPLPVEEQESSPPNIRIRNPSEPQRKRKHPASPGNDPANTAQSHSSSVRRTFATESSNSSGQKGIISSGTVSIPDHVGTMTFDHEKQIWVKQNLARIQLQRKEGRQTAANQHEETTLDEDPFKSIPDLSIDEHQEAAMRVDPKSSRPSTASTVQSIQQAGLSGIDQAIDVEEIDDSVVHRPEDAMSDAEAPAAGYSLASNDQNSARLPTSLQSEVSKHEARLHNGVPSKAPISSASSSRQPRVVTIAFSSPIASEIPQLGRLDSSAPDSEDEDFLPPEDSDDDIEYLRTPRGTPSANERSISNSRSKHEKTATLQGRPVSRIDEDDEDGERNEALSLVRIVESQASTPESKQEVAPTKPVSAYKGASILCLTPLSEFTMHQTDKANHPEESFVQARANPKALLQAHGSLALSVDTLVKAITDAVPDELFWEQLRELDLSDSRLPSTHGLGDYCSALEVLDMSNNLIAQLDGLPSSVRHLNASKNRLNDFTSWARLPNLQYVDISDNQLESLESLSSLVHMRRLKASNNNIGDIEGIVDLDGLITLQLPGNQLARLDFEGVDMPRLEELDLRDNQLTSICNLHFLPQLKRLNLSNNSLRELYMSDPLPCLKHLSISGNELETLNLAMFPALTELDLDGNCIRNIEGLSQASSLRKLSAREQRNPTGILDLVLTTPNECSEIYLSSNMLLDGQMKLPRYPHYNLRRLEVAACGLKALPQGFGDYFPNCRTLNLNFNAISDLSPLIGAVKLRKLLVASNRIKRLRRTCLALSRIPALEKIDTRDNPLTVGFYAPGQSKASDEDVYLLPSRSVSQDARWLQLLDETTSLRRRMIELMLAQGCEKLVELDGSPFMREGIADCDSTWNNLTTRGVLVRAIEAPSAESASPGVSGSSKKVVHDGVTAARVSENDAIDMKGLAQERSVTVG